MRSLSKALIALTLTGTAVPASAQEMIVTAPRRAPGSYGNGDVSGVIPAQRPVIHLKRTADYVVQPVWIAGDTREAAKRKEELEATLEEGRQAGALPGWLREGVDLEPEQRPYDPPPSRRRGEPVEGQDLVGEPVESDGV